MKNTENNLHPILNGYTFKEEFIQNWKVSTRDILETNLHSAS